MNEPRPPWTATETRWPLTLNQRVPGSSPGAPTKLPDKSMLYEEIDIWIDFEKSYKQV